MFGIEHLNSYHRNRNCYQYQERFWVAYDKFDPIENGVKNKIIFFIQIDK